jgi:hypothetical protein
MGREVDDVETGHSRPLPHDILIGVQSAVTLIPIVAALVGVLSCSLRPFDTGHRRRRRFSGSVIHGDIGRILVFRSSPRSLNDLRAPRDFAIKGCERCQKLRGEDI